MNHRAFEDCKSERLDVSKDVVLYLVIIYANTKLTEGKYAKHPESSIQIKTQSDSITRVKMFGSVDAHTQVMSGTGGPLCDGEGVGRANLRGKKGTRGGV
jgi:hypothetical protein